MSLLVIESFDDSLWSQRSTNHASLQNTWTGRTGAKSRDYYGNNSIDVYNIGVADQDDTIIVGLAFYMTNNADQFLAFYGDSYTTLHVLFKVNADGSISAYRGGTTLLGTSAIGLVTAASWNYIECKVTLSDTVGAVTVYINSALALSLTGIDTKNGGTATVFSNIRLKGNASGTKHWYADDLYIVNTAGTINNDFLGDTAVYTLFPNGNGNYSQLLGSDADKVDNYLLVDENPPSSADYVGSSVDGEKDTYSVDDLVPTVGSIVGVMTSHYIAKDLAGARSARTVIRHSATDAVGSDTALTTTYDPHDEVFEQDPITGVDWTITNVNAAEYGVEVRP